MEHITNDSDPLPSAEVHVIGEGSAVSPRRPSSPGPASRSSCTSSSAVSAAARVTDDVHGYRFNRGPHAWYLGGEGAIVLRRLGLTPTGSPPAARGAQVAYRGRTYLAPGGATSLLRTRLLGARDKVDLVAAMRRLTALDASELGSRSVRQLVDDLTGRERVAAVMHASVRLTSYVNAPDELSADVAVGQLQRAFVGGGVVYLDHGWEQLVDRLAVAVTEAGGAIRTGQGLRHVPDAPAVIVAIGGPTAASAVVGHEFPSGVPSFASSLDLGLRRVPPHRFVIGVDEPIYLSDHGGPLGMTAAGAASVSLANYLAPGDEPERRRLEAFAQRAGIAADDVVEARYLHRMTTVTAMATADGGGLAGRADATVPDRPGVFVVGDWVGRRGHLTDAVLASVEEAATAAIRHLERRTVLR